MHYNRGMAGRKPIDPSGVKRERLVVMVTPLEAESVLAHLGMLRGVMVHASDGPFSAVDPSPNDKVQLNAPKKVRIPVFELADEADLHGDLLAGAIIDGQALTFPALDAALEQARNSSPDYVPSMRECSVCGKDYDGNLHDSCPHEHVPNGKRK